jgi:hypothetical protein
VRDQFWLAALLGQILRCRSNWRLIAPGQVCWGGLKNPFQDLIRYIVGQPSLKYLSTTLGKARPVEYVSILDLKWAGSSISDQWCWLVQYNAMLVDKVCVWGGGGQHN